MTTLQGTIINGRAHVVVPVLVPLVDLIKFLQGDMPIKSLIAPPLALKLNAVSEEDAMNADVDSWQAAGKLPSFVVPWQGNDEERFD